MKYKDLKRKRARGREAGHKEETTSVWPFRVVLLSNTTAGARDVTLAEIEMLVHRPEAVECACQRLVCLLVGNKPVGG